MSNGNQLKFKCGNSIFVGKMHSHLKTLRGIKLNYFYFCWQPILLSELLLSKWFNIWLSSTAGNFFPSNWNLKSEYRNFVSRHFYLEYKNTCIIQFILLVRMGRAFLLLLLLNFKFWIKEEAQDIWSLVPVLVYSSWYLQ